jgi:hypothetical protein
MSYIADEPISSSFVSRAKFSDVEYNDWTILEAREDFGLFRRQIRKGMIWGRPSSGLSMVMARSASRFDKEKARDIGTS